MDIPCRQIERWFASICTWWGDTDDTVDTMWKWQPGTEYSVNWDCNVKGTEAWTPHSIPNQSWTDSDSVKRLRHGENYETEKDQHTFRVWQWRHYQLEMGSPALALGWSRCKTKGMRAEHWEWGSECLVRRQCQDCVTTWVFTHMEGSKQHKWKSAIEDSFVQKHIEPL